MVPSMRKTIVQLRATAASTETLGAGRGRMMMMIGTVVEIE
jgi:hypothetical protein